MKTLYQALLKTYEQGVKSMSADHLPRCAYDDGKGNRCVIGHCLSDEDFQMYGDSVYGVEDLIAAGVEIQGFDGRNISAVDLRLLVQVQEAHDLALDGKDFRESFLSNINNAVALEPEQTLLTLDEVATLKTLREKMIVIA